MFIVDILAGAVRYTSIYLLLFRLGALARGSGLGPPAPWRLSKGGLNAGGVPPALAVHGLANT